MPASRRVVLLGAAGALGAAGLGAAALRRAPGGSTPAAGSAPSPAAPVRALLDADTVTFEREEIDLGRVPLENVVPVSARLTNHSRRTVLLQQATAQTLEGC